MSSSETTVRAADYLVDVIATHASRHVFGVPGESFIAALDAIHDHGEVEFIACRHEGGAAMAACANARVTGKTGVCMVTRGPGATNASAGVHVAHQDSIPLVVFVGQVESGMRQREAFQEVDLCEFFRPIAKWTVEINDASRLPELLSRAFITAASGRPGPVIVSLPEELLHQSITRVELPDFAPPQPQPGCAEIDAFVRLLEGAKKPVLIVGGAGWTDVATDKLCELAVKLTLPVVTAFRRQDSINNNHPNYAGYLGLGSNVQLQNYVAESDLLVVLSARLGEATSNGYSLFEVPVPKQKIVHVFPEHSEIGRVYRPTLGIVSSIENFLEEVLRREIVPNSGWGRHTEKGRSLYQYWSGAPDLPAPVRLSRVVQAVREFAPRGTIVTNGAGNYASWLHRYYRYDRPRTQLAPTCGSMGYGIPAALGAAVTDPGVPVIAFAGDGCFMMTANELATIAAQRKKVIVILCNNGIYGSIRMHQEKMYPERVSGTSLVNPDFIAFAQSFGFNAERITSDDDAEAVIQRALASETSFLVEVVTDPNVITPSYSIADLNAMAASAQ